MTILPNFTILTRFDILTILNNFHGSSYYSYPENSSKIIMYQGQDQAQGLCWLVFRWATAKENLNTGGRTDPKSDKIWPERVWPNAQSIPHSLPPLVELISSFLLMPSLWNNLSELKMEAKKKISLSFAVSFSFVDEPDISKETWRQCKTFACDQGDHDSLWEKVTIPNVQGLT